MAAMFLFMHSFTSILAEKSSSKLHFYEKNGSIINEQKSSKKEYFISNLGF